MTGCGGTVWCRTSCVTQGAAHRSEGREGTGLDGREGYTRLARLTHSPSEVFSTGQGFFWLLIRAYRRRQRGSTRLEVMIPIWLTANFLDNRDVEQRDISWLMNRDSDPPGTP